jgi:4-hydroxy-4-methyl-2-oxoglutarate aldolase
MAKSPLGKLKPAAIGMTELPRLDARILAGFRALEDLTGTTSDALDECGIAGTVPASVLKPTDPGARVVGQAITVLNRKLVETRKVSGLADIEAHNLAEPGDVLVVQGVAGISSMGGVSASIGKRQGEIAAIVDGAVRDIDHSRRIGYPIWSAGVSPITGEAGRSRHRRRMRRVLRALRSRGGRACRGAADGGIGSAATKEAGRGNSAHGVR